MVYREIALAEFTGTRVHIAHVSTAMSLDLIRAAKARGVHGDRGDRAALLYPHR